MFLSLVWFWIGQTKPCYLWLLEVVSDAQWMRLFWHHRKIFLSSQSTSKNKALWFCVSYTQLQLWKWTYLILLYVYMFLNTRTRQKQHIAQLSMPTHALGILLPKINQTKVFSFVFEIQQEKNRLRMLQNYQVAFQSCVRGHP